MSKASTPNRGALLRRGIGYALLAASAGCASHAPKTQYPLAANNQQSKSYQEVCVQIGITPADGKPSCSQLAQPDNKHHVEPLPLDEFGYLFPPLKPESKQEITNAPAKVTHAAPAKAVTRVADVPVPAVAAAAVPVINAAPVVTAPSVATAVAPVNTAPLQIVANAAVPAIAATHIMLTSAAPVVIAPSVATAVAPVTAVALQPVANVAAPSIAATHVPLTINGPVTAAPAIHTSISPMTAAMPPPAKAPLAVTPHYITKTVHFSTRLPFKLNRAHLARRNREEILAFLNSLEQYRGIERIRITGHTDVSGPKHFNMWLSGMRAKSVQLLLLSLGVDPRTTSMRGVGSNEPRPHAHTAAANRYVDIAAIVREPVR